MAMKTRLALSRQRRIWVCGWIAACALAASHLAAQSAVPRISSEINNSEQAALKGSLHPMAQAQFDAGRMPAATKLEGIRIVFRRSAAQEADLKALIAAQQNPASPLYHQWLTPDQFAVRFGMAQADLDKVAGWLGQQGFSVDSVARSKNAIFFSGSAGQVEQAFSTQMHYYKVNAKQHFAPSTALSVPAALAPVILAVRNLDDFRPKSYVVPAKNIHPKPAFTSGESGNVYLAPGDIGVIYDVKPLYNAGYTGTGQSITLVGQSAIQSSDIQSFLSAAAITAQPPVPFLVPGTGDSTVYANGDEAESDIDLEWSSAMAPGATINFVYTGNSLNNGGAFQAIEYAIDQKIGTIISTSYGNCETYLSGNTLETYLEQAETQGQTVMAAAGDGGSTDCFIGLGAGEPSASVQEALAVDYPASSAYVTGVGGTEISTANPSYLAAGGGYWEAESPSVDEITSALQYIPEMAWNEDSVSCGQSNCLDSGGGGASALFAKPGWQAGVPGIPADGQRDVPDLALNASFGLPGYLFCSSDTTYWQSGQQSSCNSGFRDAATGLLTLAGGTSFASPIFAGMVALINQKAGYTTGQGLINPTLYTLAANSATYAAAFHDITSGNNDCLAGPADCSGTIGFSAGVGYDQATGLGSVDLFNLAGAWPENSASSSTLIDTTTAVTASSSTPPVNVSASFTITVASSTGASIPTGNVQITVDTNAPITETLNSNGGYVYSTSFSTAGTHVLFAAYQGDATHAPSTGSVTVNAGVASSGTGAIALSSSPATLTVAQGSQGTETITVTPSGGYTGTVLLTVNLPGALNNLCGGFANSDGNGNGNVIISGTTPVATQMVLDTNASDCAQTTQGMGNSRALHRMGPAGTARNNGGPNPAPLGVALGGLLLAGFLGRRSRKFHSVAGLIVLLAVGLALSACGGVYNNMNNFSNPPAGSYKISVVGMDSVTSTITSQTTFTFVIN
jgi:subtilase family serine protease